MTQVKAINNACYWSQSRLVAFPQLVTLYKTWSVWANSYHSVRWITSKQETRSKRPGQHLAIKSEYECSPNKPVVGTRLSITEPKSAQLVKKGQTFHGNGLYCSLTPRNWSLPRITSIQLTRYHNTSLTPTSILFSHLLQRLLNGPVTLDSSTKILYTFLTCYTYSPYNLQ